MAGPAPLFAISANIMGRILVDRARASGMDMRRRSAQHINLDYALQGLERVAPRIAHRVADGRRVKTPADLNLASARSVPR